MAGRGPAPKDPGKRARTNADPIPLRVVHADPAKQPDLDDLLGEVNPLTGAPWQAATVTFWRQLGEFPTTANLQAAQWSSLARALMIDDAMVSGETKLAGEARLRLAKYGIDPDDLARLRIQIVQADEAEEKRTPTGGAARQRRGPLKSTG
jgi:hypothetical protein